MAQHDINEMQNNDGQDQTNGKKEVGIEPADYSRIFDHFCPDGDSVFNIEDTGETETIKYFLEGFNNYMHSKGIVSPAGSKFANEVSEIISNIWTRINGRAMDINSGKVSPQSYINKRQQLQLPTDDPVYRTSKCVDLAIPHNYTYLANLFFHFPNDWVEDFSAFYFKAQKSNKTHLVKDFLDLTYDLSCESGLIALEFLRTGPSIYGMFPTDTTLERTYKGYLDFYPHHQGANIAMKQCSQILPFYLRKLYKIQQVPITLPDVLQLLKTTNTLVHQANARYSEDLIARYKNTHTIAGKLNMADTSASSTPVYHDAILSPLLSAIRLSAHIEPHRIVYENKHKKTGFSINNLYDSVLQMQKKLGTASLPSALRYLFLITQEYAKNDYSLLPALYEATVDHLYNTKDTLSPKQTNRSLLHAIRHHYFEYMVTEYQTKEEAQESFKFMQVFDFITNVKPWVDPCGSQIKERINMQTRTMSKANFKGINQKDILEREKRKKHALHNTLNNIQAYGERYSKKSLMVISDYIYKMSYELKQREPACHVLANPFFQKTLFTIPQYPLEVLETATLFAQQGYYFAPVFLTHLSKNFFNGEHSLKNKDLFYKNHHIFLERYNNIDAIDQNETHHNQKRFELEIQTMIEKYGLPSQIPQAETKQMYKIFRALEPLIFKEYQDYV